ncbi:MAG: TMEM198/TM7SF3 family protein [Blautia sp.]|nr:TMEM198/TM7SF3 family protein [Blautia sp.]
MTEEALTMLRYAREVLERLRYMQGDLPLLIRLAFSFLFFFGILNCILGYRLVRFWMMIFGFFAGAVSFLIGLRLFDITFGERWMVYGGSLAAGLIFGAIAFFLYKVGIFVVVCVSGGMLSVYLLYPTSSAMFFLCILIGIGLGAAAIWFERPLVILTTSVFGGTCAGFFLARLLDLKERPYGIICCVVFSLIGMMIQILLNPSVKSGRQENADPGKQKEENEEEMARERARFYEEFLDGEDVFDRKL